MRIIGSLVIVLSCAPIRVYTQSTDSLVFVPHGTPIIQIFGNFYSGISKGNTKSSLEIRRAYFGYSYQFNQKLSSTVKLDIGSPEDVSEFARIRRYAYFKNACVDYQTRNMKVSVGIIDLLHFKMQESYWGHRYIYKSLADEHRFGSTADIGASVSYTLSPWLTADITIMNGEGYTDPQLDNTYKGGIGISVKPVRGLVLRSYYDVMVKSVPTSTVAVFVGYNLNEKLIAGGEVNLKLNDEYIKGHHRSGYSFYITYNFYRHFQVFARYDILRSSIPAGQESPWNLARDGSAIIAGVEYSPIKNLRIALDYQDWYPYAANMENVAYMFLNVEIKI